MDYGRGITEIREALGMNMQEFAERVNSTAGTVFKFEGNYEKITKEKAEAFCNAINIPLDVYVFLCLDIADFEGTQQYIFETLGQEIKDACTAYLIPKFAEGADPNEPIDENGRKLIEKIVAKMDILIGEDESE